MRIQSIESFTQPFVGIVRVRLDTGAEGWGQMSPEELAKLWAIGRKIVFCAG